MASTDDTLRLPEAEADEHSHSSDPDNSPRRSNNHKAKKKANGVAPKIEDVAVPVVEAFVERKGATEEEMKFIHLDDGPELARNMSTVPDDPGKEGPGIERVVSTRKPLLCTRADWHAMPLEDLAADLKQFCLSYPFSHRSSIEFALPASMPKAHRLTAHKVCEELGLDSRSVGYGKKRHVSISKPSCLEFQHTFYERYVFRGYVAFEGSLVDYFGSMPSPCVSDEQRQTKFFRDGKHHHITVINRRDLETIARRAREEAETPAEVTLEEVATKLIQDLARLVPNDWKCLGIGTVKEADNETFFQVVKWESANAFREKIGLPRVDFHITMGFSKRDIHDIPKDETTLVDDT